MVDRGRELSYPKEMLIPGHQIFDPEEQFYLSRLHDGRYVLHYTDRSYYVFDEFDDHGVAPLLFMETPYRQRIAFGRENGRLVRVASSSGHHLLLHRTMTQAGERLSHIELVKGGRPGNLVEYRYDDNGHRRITGSVQSWQYTPRGLLALHTDEEKRETRWHYTAEGWIASLSNGNGALYRFSHDADGRLTGEQRPDGLIRMFVLNAGGYPAIIQTQGTEGGVRNERQERDALGRLLRSDTQHSTRTFSYNRLDQITEVTLTPTEEGERLHHMQADRVRFAYDRSGWLTAEHSVHGSIKYRRDALGNPTDITLPDGQHLSHLYYGSGHLLQTALDGITVSEYERDSLHRQVMRTQGKLATFSGYNADNRLSWQRSLPGGSQNPQQAGTPPAQNDSVTARDYIWNADGEVGGINDKLRGCLVFSYDRSGWLTSRTGQMYDHDHYYYDKAGNLLTDEYQGAVLDNRLPGYGRDRYRYNEWGELTERRDPQLEWNAQGQLTRVISSNSETRYQYDALGRRISKATYGRHTDQREQRRTTFVWEGFRLLQETTWQGKRTYLYDAEQPYTPVAAITGRGESRKIWYYHTDLTGTVHEVTAPDGTLVWAGYQAGFGENRGDISNSGAYFEQPLRLPGQYYDEETGLHYNLFRYYAPECGRFVSQDPISIRGGLNLYRYAPNPITHIDPSGLSDFIATEITTGSVFRGMPESNLFSPSIRDISQFEKTGKMPGFSTFFDGNGVKGLMRNGQPMFAEVAEIDISKLGPNLSAVWDSPKGHVSIMPSESYLQSRNMTMLEVLREWNTTGDGHQLSQDAKGAVKC